MLPAMRDKSSDPVRVSKFMALVLRHDPAAAGLSLDGGGWASVADLLRGLEANGYDLGRAGLDAIVASDGKGRYAFSTDGQRIRANQGHSAEGVEPSFERAEPPATLYHGTVASSLEPIFCEGLRRMRRHHVHLSPDAETAAKVGARRGKPVILAVDARSMRVDGHVFFRSANGVWLCEAVPAHYLSVVHGDKAPRWTRRRK